MSCKVAFLVPMYQSEKTIQGCLNSMLSQTVTAFEILVVDDGSTDASASIVDEMARRDTRIRLVKMPSNGGVARSLNAGLRETNAEFIARLDADDEAHPSRLEKQLEFMAATPEVSVCGSFVAYMGATAAQDRIVEVPVRDDEIKTELQNSLHCPFFHPSVMFRRAAVVDAGGYREIFHNSEDYDLWLRLSQKSKFYNLPTPLTRYRLSTSGATLRRLKQQRLYALLARAAFMMPDRDLGDLWTDVEAHADEPEMLAYLIKEYRHSASQLVELGFYKGALSVLRQSQKDVGYTVAANFVADQVRRLLSKSLRGGRRLS
jgi:GT2 family glycosyltransferase